MHDQLKLKETMKTQNRLSAILLLVSGLFLITGCGGNQNDKKKQTLKIGIIVPLSGNSAVLGTHSMQGAQMAIDEINDKGGLLGEKIIVEKGDSKAIPAEGVKLIKNMMESAKKPNIIFSVISGVSMAMRPMTEENRVILLSAVGTDDFIHESKYTVRNYISAATIGNWIATYVKDSIDSGSLGIFHSKTAYSTSVKNALLKKSEEIDLPIQFDIAYDETERDFKSLVSDWIHMGTKVVFIDGIGTGLGTMIKQTREAGYSGIIVSTLLVTDPDVREAAGDALTNIRYLDFAYDPDSGDPGAVEFRNAYKNKFGDEPTLWAVIGYDGMKLLLEKIKEIQSLDSDSIIGSLNKTTDFPGLFAPISVKNREFIYALKIKHIE